LRVTFATPAQLKIIAEVYLGLGGNKARVAMFMAKGLEVIQNSKSQNESTYFAVKPCTDLTLTENNKTK
jgi:hypothetical protein